MHTWLMFYDMTIAGIRLFFPLGGLEHLSPVSYHSKSRGDKSNINVTCREVKRVSSHCNILFQTLFQAGKNGLKSFHDGIWGLCKIYLVETFYLWEIKKTRLTHV